MNAPTRAFSASPAVRAQVPLLIGIMSPSGGGKTYSALRLATGIQQVFGGDIYGIDTENNRMLHYADQFKFKHVPFAAPFGSLDYLEALRWCNKQGARITIADSMTHEHIGEGGYLETAEAVVDRIAGNDYKKREAVKMLGWAKAGPLRQKMIEGIKQLDGAFIFCFRAKEKTKPVRKPDGKTEIIDMGFMPIAGEEWVYEMALNCMLEPRSEGVPTWRSDHVGERMMMKLPAQFKSIFAEQAPLSEDIGRQLATWAKGGTASPQTVTAAGPAASSQAAPDEGEAVGVATVKARLLGEIEKLGTLTACKNWSATNKATINAMPTEEKNEVSNAYYDRKEAIERATAEAAPQ
ncbi:MAG: ATP-binding protein [Actinobacteria bacterium]|nr:ATP-binding protein [Actinomycetota bacterium]